MAQAGVDALPGTFNIEVFVTEIPSGVTFTSRGLIANPIGPFKVLWGEGSGQGAPIKVTLAGGQLRFVNAAGSNFTALAFGSKTENWLPSGLNANFDVLAPPITQAAKTPVMDLTSLGYTFYEAAVWTAKSSVIPGVAPGAVNELVATWTNPDGTSQVTQLLADTISLTMTNSAIRYKESFPAIVQSKFLAARLVLRVAAPEFA